MVYNLIMKKKPVNKLDVNLTVSILKQGDYFVAYTPALDISTYGKSVTEAQNNFDELVRTFFEEFVDDERRLDNVLESLGWSKDKKAWSPPVEVKHVQQSVSIPSFA